MYESNVTSVNQQYIFKVLYAHHMSIVKYSVIEDMS